MKHKHESILKGKWFYPSQVEKPIEIIKQNWDFFYEEGYDDDDPDLNDDGEVYYILFGEYDDIRYANRSHSCLSLGEAINLVKEKTGNNITWN